MIFLSYCWKDEKIADLIEHYFSDNNIKITRDKRDLKYKQSIKEFMKTIRDAEYVIMIISQDYLQSKNCMYEVSEFVKDNDFRNRIIPIITDESGIFDTIEKINYLKFWTAKIEELKKSTEGLAPEKSIPIFQEIKEYNNVENGISDFIDTITDMNNIVISKGNFNDIHFDTIKTYMNIQDVVPNDVIINVQLKKDSSIEISDIVSLLNDTFSNIELVHFKDDSLTARLSSYLNCKDIEEKLINEFTDEAFEKRDVFLYGNAYYIVAKRKIHEYSSKTIIWWRPMSNGYTDNLKSAGYYSIDAITKFADEWFKEDQLAIKCDVVASLDISVFPINSDYSGRLIRDKSKIIGELTWDDKYYF